MNCFSIATKIFRGTFVYPYITYYTHNHARLFKEIYYEFHHLKESDLSSLFKEKETAFLRSLSEQQRASSSMAQAKNAGE